MTLALDNRLYFHHRRHHQLAPAAENPRKPTKTEKKGEGEGALAGLSEEERRGERERNQSLLKNLSFIMKEH
jgi:hypothetical protein